MATSALQKITKRAKAIRKAHPGISWKSAVKKAGVEYRGGKISGVKKKRATAKGKTAGRSPRRVSGVEMPAGSSIVQARRELKERLGWTLATMATAKTKKEKKGLAVKAAELKRKYNALQ